MRKFVLFFLVVLASSTLFAQNRPVSGVISAQDGTPVVGATVVVSGTNIAAITDGNGRYSLNAPAGGTLTISHLGTIPQTVPISNRSVIDVTLQTDTQTIEQIVVLGLGVTRAEKSAGFATQKVGTDLLTQTHNTSLSGSLQGKVSGIQITPSSGMPGASSQIVIRGARSFTGNNTPLYVVDGMPINSGIDLSTNTVNNGSVSGTDYANRGIDIDPNDIEDIQILKGQAASALYGMRASNGVVMITTKSGRSGEKGRTNVTFNTSVTIDRISRYPDLQSTYAQGSQVLQGTPDKWYYSYAPDSGSSWGPKIADLAKDPVYGYGGTGPKAGNADKPLWDKWIGSAAEGKYFVPQRARAGLDPWVAPAVYKNRIKDFFQTGVTFNNSVNVSRSTDTNMFSFTFSSANQKGFVPSTGMERYNAKLLAETKLGKAWTMGFSGNYVNSRLNKSTGANGGLVATIYPAPPSYDLVGIPSHYEGLLHKQNTYRGTTGFDAADWAVKNNVFQENTGRFFGNAYLMFKPRLNTPDHNLNFRAMVGTDTYATKYRDAYGYGHLDKTGDIYERLYDITNFNGTITANYSWNINDKLRLDASLGSEFTQTNTKSTGARGWNLNFPGQNHINNATQYDASEERLKSRTVGFFGTATLGYADMLFLTVTGRSDVASSMPTGHRSFFYPSVNVSWIFTELETLKNRVLTYGKLRLAFSQVGQSGRYYPPYYVTPLYGGGFYGGNVPVQYPKNGMTAFVPSVTVYDPSLRPQNTNSVEAGIELRFWNGLLGLDYTYTHQNVKNQIFSIPMAPSSGIEHRYTNGGHIVTNSHEATLTINPRLGKDFAWVTAINFTAMDNRVKALADGVDNISLGGFVDPQIRAAIGERFPSIFGTAYERDEEGRIVFDEDDMPIGGEAKVIGTVAPKFIMGLNTTFSWKRLSLGLVFEWKNGGQAYGGTAGMLDYYGVSERSRILRETGVEISGVHQKANGDPDGIPFTKRLDPALTWYYLATINNISESSVYDTSFVKLREITLGYDFKVGKVLDMGVNVFARNLLLWTKYPHFDPESSQANDNMAGGFERFSLPQMSNFGLGLTFRF